MNERILLVDDEPDVLKSFQVLFRRRYQIDTAPGGEEALDLIRKSGPYAVIIADMHMPHMDGVTLLRTVSQVAPDTIRVMLTANADQQTAANAVNEGQIFRFLTKPCPMDVMLQTLTAATNQYHLITAERVLLEQTLKGSVDVLIEALALCNPAAFQRTRRIRNIAGQLLDLLQPDDRWEIEIAAALSQAGCLTVPEELLQRSLHGLNLTPSEEHIIHNHPQAGGKLIAHIPRLERVAQMIALQKDKYADMAACSYDRTLLAGAAVLRAAIDFDTHLFRGESPEAIARLMQSQPDHYHPALLPLLAKIRIARPLDTPQRIHVNNLQIGMITAEDIRSVNGLLVVPQGFSINDTVRHRLINFAEQRLIADSIRVYAPTA